MPRPVLTAGYSHDHAGACGTRGQTVTSTISKICVPGGALALRSVPDDWQPAGWQPAHLLAPDVNARRLTREHRIGGI
jgi:hypothetical protein